MSLWLDRWNSFGLFLRLALLVFLRLLGFLRFLLRFLIFFIIFLFLSCALLELLDILIKLFAVVPV